MEKDRKVLFHVGDGPEGIEIYSSEEEAVVDWANYVPAIYVVLNTQGATVKLGPFQLITEEMVQNEIQKRAG